MGTKVLGTSRVEKRNRADLSPALKRGGQAPRIARRQSSFASLRRHADSPGFFDWSLMVKEVDLFSSGGGDQSRGAFHPKLHGVDHHVIFREVRRLDVELGGKELFASAVFVENELPGVGQR